MSRAALALGLTLTLAPAAAWAAPTPPAPAASLREQQCGIMVEVAGETHLSPVEGLKLLGGPDHLTIGTPAGAKLVAVFCVRTGLVPDVRDVRVLDQFSVPFYVKLPDNSNTLVLEVSGGRYRVRTLSGGMSEDDAREVMKVLNFIQTQSQTKP